MTTRAGQYFQLTAVTAALFAAFGSAMGAEGDDLKQLTKPESSVEAGIGYVDNDNQRFGMYNGLKSNGPYGLLDLNVVQRDDATGTWLKFTGRNLGLDNRELRFEHNRQGNWGYFLEYGETPRNNPFGISTRLSGAGSTAQTINGTATPYALDLKTKRDALSLGFEKLFVGGFSVQVKFKNEEKDGARMYGQGSGAAINFLTDPINQTTRQLDVVLSYAGDKLQLSGGYYGSSFENHNNLINVTGGIAGQTPMALPPDNQSHQLYLSGGYNFTSTTRGTFKVAYSHQTQNETFIVLPTLSGRTNLGGTIDTKLLQAGITSRPLPKLSLLANVRYEDRPDKTPVALYNTPGGTQNGFNEPRSMRTLTGKTEASYSLPMGFRLTGGLDYDQRNRNFSPVRVVSAREETEEKSWRVELRRSMSETITGAVSFVHSDRDGSPFLTTLTNTGTFGSNLIAPSHLADRKRDKVRLSMNWNPTDELSLQFFADEARDTYTPRTLLGFGPSSGKAQNYTLDATYAFSPSVSASAWYSRNDSQTNQATCSSIQVVALTGVMTCNAPQIAHGVALRNVGDSIGLGLRGKPKDWLEIGAEFSYSDINDEYRERSLNGTALPVGAPPPDVATKLTSLKAYAKFAIQKNAGVRLQYIFDQVNTNDWTWTNFTYSDGTRVFQNPNQKVHFIGVSYYYRWQ